MSAAAAPVPDARPPVPWKGAWGGAWTVVYGCYVLASGTLGIAFAELLGRAARLLEVRLRVLATDPEQGETSREVAAFLADAPTALGGGLGYLHWADVGLALLVVLAGLGVLRRGEFARRAALALLAAEALLGIGFVVAWQVAVVPVQEAWLARGAELGEFLVQAAPNEAPPVDELFRLLQTLCRMSLMTSATTQILHLTVLALLAVRLAGPDTRAWCRGVALPPGRE